MNKRPATESTSTDKLSQHDLLDDIVAAMPGHVYWKDLSGKYLGCNEMQAQSLGLNNRNEIINKKPYENLSPEARKHLQSIDKKVLQEGRSITLEEPGIRENGETGTFLTKKTPLLDHNGSIIGLLGISFDITEKKHAHEKHIKALKRQESILSSIVNEFRSLYQVIMPSLDKVSQLGVSAAQQAYLNDIREGCIENHLLLVKASEAAKLESGTLSVLAKETPILPLVEHALINSYGKLAKPIDAFITMDDSANLNTTILADSQYLTYILGFTFEYAIKRSTEQSVQIKLSSDDRTFYISIFDGGGKIDPVKFQKLFSNMAFESSLWGDSISLAYCRRFIEKMNGNYTVLNEDERGVEYQIGLPLLKHGIKNKPIENPTAAILIDDNSDRAQSIVECISGNFAVHTSSNLDEIKTLDLPSYKLVIINDDFSLLPECYQFFQTQKISIIILTKSALSNELRLILSEGSDNFHYIEKPILPSNLAEKITSVCNKEKILIVDDAPLVRRVLTRIFSEAGYEVDTAESGEEAIEKVRTKHACIIMDIGMPGISGIETANIIQEQLGELTPPIIALTGETNTISLDAIYDENCFAEVRLKGAGYDELISAIKALIDDRKKGLI